MQLDDNYVLVSHIRDSTTEISTHIHVLFKIDINIQEATEIWFNVSRSLSVSLGLSLSVSVYNRFIKMQ